MRVAHRGEEPSGLVEHDVGGTGAEHDGNAVNRDLIASRVDLRTELGFDLAVDANAPGSHEPF